MILLGLIIVLLAIAAGTLLFLATQNLTDPIELEAAGFQISATPLALLIAGAAVMLILWLGLAMIRSRLRRGARRRREAKEATRAAENEQRIREDERARIAAEAPPRDQRFAGHGDAALGAAGAATAAGAMGGRHDTRSRDDEDAGRRDTGRGDLYDQDAERTRALPADSRTEWADDRRGRHGSQGEPGASETTVYSTSDASEQRSTTDAADARSAEPPRGERTDAADRRTGEGDAEAGHRPAAGDTAGSDRTVADDVMGRTHGRT